MAFTAMYATQPVLPQIGHDFAVAPAEAGLTLSGVTFALALASLGAGRLADRLGSRRVMLVCSFALSALCFLVVLAPVFWMLVALRALQGLMVPGITVAGLAFLHNELPASWRGRVSGFYIAANTLGGLVGRLGVGLSVQAIGWRGGLLLVAFAATAGSVVLVVGMPRGAVRGEGERVTTEETEGTEGKQRATAEDAEDAEGESIHRGGRRAPGAGRRGAIGEAKADIDRPAPIGQIVRRAWWAPLIGGTVFFPFLSVFTYITYRLEGSPFDLPASRASLFYLVYLLGAVASPLAGQLSDRIGRRPTILGGLVVTAAGLLIGLPNVLPLALLGLALVCVGSLSSHAVANASVSDTANPLGARARATALALYTLGFYIGGGLGAYVPGYGWARYGWIGVVVPCAVAVFCAGLVATRAPHHARKEPAVPAALNVP
ncbi:MAG TPA: MFS transporter [Ktedonobacterales bacterium]